MTLAALRRGKETASNIEWKDVWVLDLVWTRRTKRKISAPARHRNPTVKPLAAVFTKLLNIILHTTGSQFSALMKAHRNSEEMSEWDEVDFCCVHLMS